VTNYPKEVLDALKEKGITFKDKNATDNRLCYGAMCTWFGPISETRTHAEGHLPVCPHCGGVLFEIASENEWWANIEKYERERPYPGYKYMMEWQRAQKKCFKDITRLEEAYQAAMLDKANVVLDHGEAWNVACFRREESNLARCYIDAIHVLRMVVNCNADAYREAERIVKAGPMPETLYDGGTEP
jgi:hypothetical protein